jgi:hypothetical protein
VDHPHPSGQAPIQGDYIVLHLIVTKTKTANNMHEQERLPGLDRLGMDEPFDLYTKAINVPHIGNQFCFLQS